MIKNEWSNIKTVNCIVIDDEQEITDLICDILDMNKINVLAKGHNGEEAVKLYKKYNPDIVFTDLTMPEYDGYYAIENIKDVNLNAKIIVVTGNSNEDDMYFFDLLKIPVVTKPFDIKILSQIVRRVSAIDTVPSTPFEIKYKFKNDPDFYTCAVTYEQYRNFKKIPIIQECKIIKNNTKNVKLEKDKMQIALDMAVKNDNSHLRRLSEIIVNGGTKY